MSTRRTGEIDASDVIERVRTLNAQLNAGRGSEVLRQVIGYLERGDVQSAIYKCTLDSDKLIQYDGCLIALADMGMLDEHMTQYARDREARRAAAKKGGAR